MPSVLEMKGITQNFPGVCALDKVEFTLKLGEIHALVGENGAGKSTLMKILGGVYSCDEGEICVDGRCIKIAKPSDAIKLGISIIYQEFNLAPNLSVAENIFLGMEPRKGKNSKSAFVDKQKVYTEATEILAYLQKESIDIHEKVKNLTVSQQQIVEIAKAIRRESRILVMDEPTAVLTDNEVQVLFSIIKKLKNDGVSIVYISHRMDEILKICDRATILRDGQLVCTMDFQSEKIQKDQIIRQMVGRDLGELYVRDKQNADPIVVLSVHNYELENKFKDISFELHKGEILGFFGLVGAGRTELMRSIFGLEPPDLGDLQLFGKKVKIRRPTDAIAKGIGLVPEDRKRQGLITVLSLKDNIVLSALKKIARAGFVTDKRKRDLAEIYVEKLNIKPRLIERKIKFFSGGNQQKAVLAKWLTNGPKILILDEPTRGIDIGAKQEIYSIMSELTKSDMSIIFVSSEIEEIIGISDRIVVMREGQIAQIFDDSNISQEKVLMAASL